MHSSGLDAHREGKGVCQDFAHLTLILLRGMGIPARYVSGYLHPKSKAKVGDTIDGQSHAWVQAWTGGWWNYDPTNDTDINEQYVSVGVGRDYSDVTPLKGIYSGGRVDRPGRRRRDHQAGLERVGGTSERAVAGVNMWRQALNARRYRQQLVQGVALLCIQPRGEHPVVLTPQLADLADHLLAGRGQMERMESAVVGVAATFDVAAVLQLIDIGDDPAR